MRKLMVMLVMVGVLGWLGGVVLASEIAYGINSTRIGKADLEGYGSANIWENYGWKWVAPLKQVEEINGYTYEAIALNDSGTIYKIDMDFQGSALGYWNTGNFDSIYPLWNDPNYNYIALNAGRVSKLHIPEGYTNGYDATWSTSENWHGLKSVCPLFGVDGFNAAFVGSTGAIARLNTVNMQAEGVGGASQWNWKQISPLRGDEGYQLIGVTDETEQRLGKLNLIGYGSAYVTENWRGHVEFAASSAGDPNYNGMFVNDNGSIIEVNTTSWTGPMVGGVGGNWSMMLPSSIPEPATIGLVSFGAIGFIRRKK